MADSTQSKIVSHGIASPSPSYLEWGPVWGGAIVAIAISTILAQFGATVGLAAGDPIRADNTVSYNFIAVSLWLLLVSISSSGAAGYIAGRMRMTMNDSTENEVEFRDGIHGLAAWALSTVVIVTVATISTTILAVVAATDPVAVPELSVDMQNFVANQIVIVGFASASGAALGAAAAWFASITGGKHRNDGTSFNKVVPTMFRK